MLACTEMITMCLQSAKQEHLRRQQELDHNQNQGTSLVQDVSTLWFICHQLVVACYSSKTHPLVTSS